MSVYLGGNVEVKNLDLNYFTRIRYFGRRFY